MQSYFVEVSFLHSPELYSYLTLNNKMPLITYSFCLVHFYWILIYSNFLLPLPNGKISRSARLYDTEV